MNLMTDDYIPSFFDRRPQVQSEQLTIVDPINELKDGFIKIGLEAKALSKKAEKLRPDRRIFRDSDLTTVIDIIKEIRALAKQVGLILEEGSE
jgi:hypothetical protein